MKPVIIFAGTLEGRTLSEYLAGKGIPVVACVATEYGEGLFAEQPGLMVHSGRMDEEQMAEWLREQDPVMAVDATHPYARVVSENLIRACETTRTEYLRLVRETSAENLPAGTVRVDSVDEAVEYLRGVEGNILAATGSKELAKYTSIPDYESRVYARVLSTAEVAAACEKLGFRGRNLICMQGPFTEELNTAMLRQFRCKYLVTKETGNAGGFAEKIRAAERAGAKVVLVRRPEDHPGFSYQETVRILEERLGLPHETVQTGEGEIPAGMDVPSRVVSLVGIGMGPGAGMTLEAEAAVKEAELLVGASRMLETADCTETPSFCAYDPQKIADYIDAHPEYRRVAVLLSGDIGFYSGAKRLYEAMEGRDWEVRGICGISSVVYFCSRLRMSWEDVCLKSAHGRRANFPGTVRTHRKTFTLLGGRDSVGSLCRELIEYGLPQVRIHVGERLGYEEERIVSGTPAELAEGEYDGLCVALIENPQASDSGRSCIDDEEFIRGKAPMTKSEVRCLSAAKLRLPSDAVIYDVGAGTGSVSVEMALQAPDGMVYAIERSGEACGLIERNKRKFGTPNIQVVEGTAPEAMEGLPSPTHAFIGGSAGNLKQILECLLAKNPRIRVVINTVTLETVGEVIQCLKELPLTEEEILSVSTARSRKLGSYHLMTGQNPIYIVTCRGGAS